jgi:hypothetical protein
MMTASRAAGLCLLAALAGGVRSAAADDASEPDGKILRLKGGGDKAHVPGGAVIVDADGRRLELIPPKRPAPAPGALKAVAALPKLSLPTLDDPAANLETRKHRALGLLLGGALLAVALAYWARRWRPNV